MTTTKRRHPISADQPCRTRRPGAAALLSALALGACGGEGGSGSAGSSAVSVATSGTAAPVPIATATATPTPTPTPAPTPTPTSSGTATSTAEATPSVAPSLAGVDAIASNFAVSDYLQKSWGSGDIPSSAAPDVVGAFRFLCAPSHNAADDPIVYPGQPGKSHLHTFFGNTGTNAFSTYQSLRTSGGGTCNNMLNRSAYWVPAMMTPAGKVVMPNYVSIYYKRRPDTDPFCKTEGIACIALPRGLRYVFGYNMANPASGATPEWVCDNNNTVTGPFKTIPEAAKTCPVGAMLGARLSSPSCWDGKNLDSADHRSHMAFTSYGNWGYQKCPATHPYVLPTFSIAAWYKVDGTLDRSGDMAADARTWYLSSDRMAGMAWQTPGTTFHSDWFGAWDDSIMQLWTAHCINKLLNCSGGDLGNGQQLKTLAGYNNPASTVLVDPPA